MSFVTLTNILEENDVIRSSNGAHVEPKRATNSKVMWCCMRFER